jgi:hypothetical protein
MAVVTTYSGWVAAGRPARPAQPIADMVAMFRAAGYPGTGYYPDDRHLLANPPEDHTPYSHTPWPGSQPYPLILALDLMPLREGDGKSLAPIARRIIADKRAGRAPWIKYLNWTDEQGHVWHTRWQPNEAINSSSDSGHIHISIRTDYATSTAARGWNPTLTLTEDDMALDLNTIVPGTNGPDGSPARTLAFVLEDLHKTTAPGGYHGWQTAALDAATAAAAGVKTLLAGQAADAQRDAVTLAAIQAIATGGTSVDTTVVLAAIRDAAAAESAKVTELLGEVAELRAALAAAAQAEAGALAQ